MSQKDLQLFQNKYPRVLQEPKRGKMKFQGVELEIKSRSGIYCFIAETKLCSRERKYDFQPRETRDERVMVS